MGHSSTRIIQDTYQHVSDVRKREAAERISGALLGRSEGA
jgi:integrase